MSSIKLSLEPVSEFHEVFEIGNALSPKLLEAPEFELRHRLLHEENEEYLEACKTGNLTEIADALGDQLYILFCTILKHGLQHKFDAIFNEIHRSNMSKLDANGRPIRREDGKILKSEKYFKPNIALLLKE